MEKKGSEDLTQALFRFYWLYNEKITRPMMAIYRDTFTQAQFFVLSVIAASERVPMSELVERTQMPKQQLTKMINQLEDGGYVRRLRSREDRRLVNLELTEKAAICLERYMHIAKANVDKTFAALAPHEFEDFHSSLLRIDSLLEKLPSGIAFEDEKPE